MDAPGVSSKLTFTDVSSELAFVLPDREWRRDTWVNLCPACQQIGRGQGAFFFFVFKKKLIHRQIAFKKFF